MTWGSYSYLFGPLVSFGVVGVLMLLLRWTFSRGGSLVARPPRPGTEEEYGLLVSVASPATYVEAEMSRLKLAEAGLRVTVARTVNGPRVMVFAEDEARARRLLASG
ncbi:MAG: DUF2007 domain-containing protein [Actinomycetota bacterium]|nr:DUF2007 domain-containing protein [Actinomycetota bacterium]